MRRSSGFCLLFGLILVTPQAAGWGQELPITEERFLGVLADDHAAVIAASEALGTARAARRRAATLGNPLLQLEREAPAESPRETTWGLAWAPPLDGRRGLSIRAAEASLAAAAGRFDSEMLGLRLEMRAAFARWALARDRRDVLTAHLRRFEGLAERMQRRAEAGEESGLAARRVELAAVDARAALRLAEVELVRAAAAALAWDPQLAPQTRPLLPALPPVPAALDLAARRDLEAGEQEVAAARLAGRLARRPLSFPELLLGWKRIEERGVGVDGPVFGITWSVPLFDRRQADRLEADQALASAEARLELAARRAEAGLAAAREVYRRLAAAAAEAAHGRDGLERLIEGATASYLAGESGTTDLLDALRSALAAEAVALDVYAAALEAHRHLEAAAGRPLTAGGKP